MRLAIKLVAFVSSLLAFVAILGVGVAAAVVRESGVRGSGVLLALAALVAFASATSLAFAPAGFFRSGGRRPIAIAAAMAALAPLVVFAFATLQFAMSSIGGDTVMIVGAFALGGLFVFGGIAILALAWQRIAGGYISSPVQPDLPTQPRATAVAPPVTAPVRTPRAVESFQGDEDIRVTRV